MHPILLDWNGITIGSYAALLDLGLIVASIVVWIEARRWQIRSAIWLDAILAAITIGVVAARLGYAAINFSYFKDHLYEIPRIWDGGLNWQAGLIGGSIGAWLIAHRQKDQSPMKILDLLAIGVPIGIALGWIGCYLAAAAYGKEMFPGQPLYFISIDAPDQYGSINPRWPSQLFGATWALVVFGLLALTRNKKWPDGMRFWIFMTLYSLGAFLIGFMRADDMPIISGWRLDQILDGALMIIGMTAVILSAHRARRISALIDPVADSN
ncbi:MAG TPA: prolipoprotein diacylglyceryl transferase family protein [Anaerolineae bacterium]|nr:prolipoprotein diacylglyceryl transferase family protein [Anaerolineae bacterium]